jgi:transcriptional regulator with XRE-family HTH domain
MAMTMMAPTAVRPNVNEPLLLALARQQRRHWQVASLAEIHPSQLSLWLNGHKQPTPEQAERLAAVLNQNVTDLFPSLCERAPDARPKRARQTGDAATVDHSSE